MTLDLTYGQGESRSNGLSGPHLARILRFESRREALGNRWLIP